jgi:hypothetical protein
MGTVLATLDDASMYGRGMLVHIVAHEKTFNNVCDPGFTAYHAGSREDLALPVFLSPSPSPVLGAQRYM